ncbi:MAG: class I SAM-dependent methyltransferase [bacterium]
MNHDRGHRGFAAVWDWMSRHESPRERELRAEVVGGARGQTLELGYGVGSNWPFLPPGVGYTGIEPDPAMRRRAEAHRPHGRELTLLDGDAQALGFPDDAFDTVIATLVFCTIPEPRKALAEAIRVLRPGGEFVFFEHVRAEGAAGSFAQTAMTPLWQLIGGGCHLNRKTLDAISATGFASVSSRRMKIGALPVIVGKAVKSL